MDRKISQKPWIKRRYRNLLVVVLSLLLVAFFTLMFDTTSAYRVDMETVTVSEVTEAAFEDYINVRGRVEPATIHYLDAVEGGIVKEIFVEDGAYLRVGDTILTLSNLNLSLNILNSEAQLAEKANFLRETQLNMEQQKLTLERELLRLDNDLVRLQRTYEQNQGFFKEKLISSNEYLESEEAYKLGLNLRNLTLRQHQQDSIYRKNQIAKISGSLKSMEKNLELIYQRQDHLVVRSPIDGQLASLDAMQGQSIAPGMRLGQVNMLTKYKLRARIDEHYIDRVEVGQKATVEREGKLYDMTLAKVYPEVSEGFFRVDLSFDEAMPENIRSGQSYNLSLALGESSDGLLLARGGFFQATGGQWVFVLNSDNEATKRSITLGRQNPRFYEILEGLKPGEQVITSGYERFGESEKLILN